MMKVKSFGESIRRTAPEPPASGAAPPAAPPVEPPPGAGADPPTGGPPPPSPPPPAAGPAWLGQLGDPDLAANPSLTKFEDPSQLARSYVELQGKLGQQGKILPGEGATPQETRTAMAELGCPPDVTGYVDPAWPEGLPEDRSFLEGMKGLCHHIGLTDKQWSHASPLFLEMQRQQLATATQAWTEFKEKGETELKTAWGEAYPAKVAEANDAMGAVFGDNWPQVARLTMADGTPIGSHPAFIAPFAKLYEKLASEGTLLDGLTAKPTGTKTPADAIKELNAMMADADQVKALNDAAHVLHAETVDKKKALYAMAYPSATGATSDGVTVGGPTDVGGF